MVGIVPKRASVMGVLTETVVYGKGKSGDVACWVEGKRVDVVSIYCEVGCFWRFRIFASVQKG